MTEFSAGNVPSEGPDDTTETVFTPPVKGAGILARARAAGTALTGFFRSFRGAPSSKPKAPGADPS